MSQKEKVKYHILTHIYNRILLSLKRNTPESVIMRWTNPEPIIQSEVSQKKKNK